MIVLLLATLGVAGGFFWARGHFLRAALEKTKTTFAMELRADLTWSEPKWNGLMSFGIDSLRLRRNSQELLAVDGLAVKASLAGLMTGGKRLRALGMHRIQIPCQLKGEQATTPKTGRKLPSLPSALADLPALLTWLPPDLEVDSIQISIGNSCAVHGSSMRWRDNQIDFRFNVSWKDKASTWIIRGNADPDNLEMQGLLVGPEDKPWQVDAQPIVLGDKWKWEVSLSHPGGWVLEHPMLAPTPLTFPRTGVNLVLLGGEKVVSLAAGSDVTLDQFVLSLSGAHDFIRHDWRFGIDAAQQDAQSLMGALPAPNLFEQMKVTGAIDFAAEVNVPGGTLSEMELHFSRLTANIVADTNASLSPRPGNVFAEPFRYEPRRSDRVITVDRKNAHHLSLDEIPRTLQAAVLAAEDPNFRTHSGLDTTILRKAFADNLSDGKFSRGGSTISMQLAKMLYLDSRKDLQRKVNQILLAWMMESGSKQPKDDLLELYLNVIEWGPEVFGISEAASFYFGKRPSELALDECLFLAGIIPNPKHYGALLEEDGAPNAQALMIFDLLKYQLWETEKISDEALDAEVRLLLSPKAIPAH